MREEGSRRDMIRWLYCNWTWLVPDWGLFSPALPLWWLYQIFQSYLGHLLPEEALEPGPLSQDPSLQYQTVEAQSLWLSPLSGLDPQG